MQTRKYPRTLEEAFGPYTSKHFVDPDTDYSTGWWVAMYAIGACTCILIGLTSCS